MKHLTLIFTVLLALALIAPLTYGQINWIERTVDPSIPTAKFAEGVDLDEDGDMDVLGTAIDNIYFYENNGYQVFTEIEITSTFSSAYCAHGVDLDGDGDLDIVGGAYGGDEIAWWENDGEENFTYSSIAYFDGCYEVHVLDMDGDLDMDIVANAYAGDKVSWFENDGSQNFTEHQILSIDGPGSIDPVDIDGDGDLDVFSAAYFADEIGWLENDGSMNFTYHLMVTLDGGYSIRAGDFDNDGDMDCAVGSYSAYLVNWYENDGSQNFSEHNVALAIGRVRDIDNADIDEDGDLDIVVGSDYAEYVVYWYENDGSGIFTQNLIADLNGIHDVDAVDMDSDGDLDVLVPGYYANKIVYYESDFGGAFPLTLTLTPESLPIQIPAGGGSFDFDITIENNGTVSYTVDVWMDVTLPVGTIYPILNRQGITLGAAASISRDLTQFVPGTAMPGGYSYGAHMRDSQTWQVYLHDSFPFEKLEGLDEASHNLGWALFGWDEWVAQTSVVPEDYQMISAYPNPFNPTTTLTYSLPELSEVSLKIYDVKGCLVTTLVNGWREAGIHEVSFDGSNLSSGAYLYTLEAGDFTHSGKLILMK